MSPEIFTLPDPAKVEAFLADLTTACIKHGIGLSGEPTMFVMETDDYERKFRPDDEGNISFE